MPSRTVVTGTPEISMLSDLRDVLRRQSHRAHAILIDHELQVRRLLVPIEMRIDHSIVGAHHVAHLVGDVADLVGIGTDDAELHREADRRPKIETIDAHPRLRQRAVGDGLFDPRLDPLARLDVLRDDHDLGEGSRPAIAD